MYAGVTQHTEPITPSIVFDIASLVLYDCQAIPIRIKFSLDRLFSVLQHEDVLQILHGFGWSYEDYARGYILQDATGRVLEKWSLLLKEEENIVIQQFLRFAETRKIAQELLCENKPLQNEVSNQAPASNAKADSDIRKFIERNNMALIQSYNLALRRAFDNPQSLFSAMAAFPSGHLNMAASAASQFGRVFPPNSGIMGLPTTGFSQSIIAKAESAMAAEPINRKVSSEPYDLSNKRSPESLKSSSPALSVTASSHTMNLTTPNTPTNEARGHSDMNSSSGSAGLRKASSPISNMMRKPGSPSSNKGWPFNNPAFGQTVFVTSSGKKRVLCTACNKTFCDKGALKIHYSAVHLKEMHQCTIPGCNMMFSSRRSRNRHSANPNPKLHTPQTRRPRERYDASQDQMMALMGLPHSQKSDDDDSSGEENEVDDKMRRMLPGQYNGLGDKSVNGSDDGNNEEFGDDEFEDDLPTQLKQESPLYGSSKRKRLMPTRVSSGTHQNAADDDTKSVRSICSRSQSPDGTLDVDDSSDGLQQKRLAEVREDSPAEPGEVIRRKNPEEKNTDKQTSSMNSFFSSFLPQMPEHTANDFWSNFIQQTAAAQKAAQRQVAQEHIGRKIATETDDLIADTKPNHDPQKSSQKSHIKVIKSHSAQFRNGDGKTESDDDETSIECRYCEKLFPSIEALERHTDVVHQGQEIIYPEPAYTNHIDSLKSKTPVIA